MTNLEMIIIIVIAVAFMAAIYYVRRRWIKFSTPTPLPENHITYYNGVRVKWRIGDRKYRDNYDWWWVHGHCNGKQYQLVATYRRSTRELFNIQVNTNKKNRYYDEKTHKLLTQKEKK